MQQPPVPENESKRIEALLTYQILDTLPEQVFNDLTLIASQICKTPVALFGLIDQNRQWFKSKIGIDLTEVPRDLAFCAHTIAGSNSLVVPDLSNDPRFADHPFVTGAPHARYYAGAPIVTKEGLSVGAICVVDTVPHEIDRDQIQALEAIARQILSHLETRNLLIRERELSTELSLSKVQLDEFFDLARDFLVVCEADGRFSRVSQSLVNVLGYTEEEIFSTPFINFLHPDDVESTRVGVNDNVVIGKARTISNRYRTKEGRYVNLSWNYASNSDGKIYAVARDVTEQLALEHNLILAKEKAEAA
ncbi:MAG: GAF domain-containing protein, partial [Proteobacteria bacterium]